MGDSPSNNDAFLNLTRFLGPLVAGKTVSTFGIVSDQLPEAATIFPLSSDKQHADFVVCLDPDSSNVFLNLPELEFYLDSGAIIAGWSRESNPKTALNALHKAHYLYREFGGVIICDARFAQSRVAALRNSRAGDGPQLHLHLWSQAPLPALPLGLYEGFEAGEIVPSAAPLFPLERQSSFDLRMLSLVKRLLVIEERTMELRSQNTRLRAELTEQGVSDQHGYFDVPKSKHSWPLAETPTRLPAALGPYDRRPDDSVIIEAQAGETFIKAYDLLGNAPSFAAAIQALNAQPRLLQLGATRPEVSIVIPVYGQLAYTLNCLHSLFAHTSRFNVEIIIVDDCSPDYVTEEFVRQIEGIRYHRQPDNGGFIKSCNTGGELARGAYILMLNSDTRVVTSWLDEIISSFDLFPKSGLVGSKMIYPDGVLQEAGGILWRDGSAWNYGRNDDPNRPQYCFARKVDYVSGCSIAMRTELWRELGGFDPHYTPAYAEDADLCQRVLANGHEVWFQPNSRVVHYEGKTSGTSTSSGIKAYQITNLKKLFLRWRKRFEAYRPSGEAPFFERERDVTKRILFVDAVTPTPNQDAGSVQTVMGIQAAQLCGYKVHFVPEDNWLFEPHYTAALQREGVDCAYAPFELSFEAYIRRYGWLFDVIIVYRISVMYKVLPLLKAYAPQALRLFHVADLHFLRMQRQAQLEGSHALFALAEQLKEKEMTTVSACDCTITHSTVEADIISELLPEAPVIVWPLMIPRANAEAPSGSRSDICFLGGYRHPPNVDAVFYFVKAVLPLIHRERPEIRFIVAGANPTPEILALASDHIVVTGMVDDLADVFDAARVFVCPLRIGAGAKGKVMSALSYGIPIVSTSIGVEGAGLVADKHILVADDPALMTRSILRLYDDPILWQSLATAGRDLVRAKFSLDMGRQKLEEAVDKAYRQRLGLADV